jgi:hypothetical protein
MAFLKASVAPERILEASRYDVTTNPSSSSSDSDRHREGPAVRSSSSVTSCLDVDAFTAAHMKGRADNETWPEKMSRRVGKVVNSLSELSGAFCDIACCLGDDAVRDKPPPPTSRQASARTTPRRNNTSHQHQHQQQHPRHQHPRPHFHYSDLELDDQDSQMPTQGASAYDKNFRFSDRRFNSMSSLPAFKHLELSRKSSC